MEGFGVFIFISFYYFHKNTYLESSHVSGIAGVLEAILIAFQEEFEEKSERNIKLF